MDDLVPNPDGCTRFDPNQFKKEKCKSCGRQWFEHKGAITPEQVEVFVKAKQRVQAEQNKKEAEAKEKARQKAIAKKKQNQAVEDEWFFDGNVEMPPDSDDDTERFRMMDMTQIARSEVKPVDNKPVKIMNLIDFSECDVQEDKLSEGSGPQRLSEPDTGLGMAASPVVAGGSPSRQSVSHSPPGSARVSMSTSNGAGMNAVAPAQLFGPPAFQEEELLSEIEHLRQMLADAQEEKSIQVAIVRDEVVEKQQLLDDLQRQRAEIEQQLRDARDHLWATEDRLKQTVSEREEALALAEKNRADAELQSAQAQEAQAEAQRLQTEVAQLRGECPAQGQGSSEQGSSERQQQLEAEVQQLRDQLAKSAPPPPPTEDLKAASAQADKLKAEVEALKAAMAEVDEPRPSSQVAAVPPEVEQAQAEVQRLKNELSCLQASATEAVAQADEVQQLRAELELARLETNRHAGVKTKLEADLQDARAELARMQAAGEIRAELARVQAAGEREQAAEVQQLRSQVAKLQASALEGRGNPSQVELTPAVANMLAEMRELCNRTQELLGSCTGNNGNSPNHQPGSEQDCSPGRLEVQLRGLTLGMKAVHSAAVHAGTEYRALATALQDEKALSVSKRGSESHNSTLHSDLAAQALREMRLSAQQALAQIQSRSDAGRHLPSVCA